MIVSLSYLNTILFFFFMSIWLHKQPYVFFFWCSGWMQAAPHPSLYPCAVTDNMLGPVQIDIINKRTRGGSGQSPSYFAEWKTFLLTWTQQSRPSFPETEFAASLVKPFFQEIQRQKHNFDIHRNTLKAWKQTKITGTWLFFYKPTTFTLIQHANLISPVKSGCVQNVLLEKQSKRKWRFSAAHCYRVYRIYSYTP